MAVRLLLVAVCLTAGWALTAPARALTPLALNDRPSMPERLGVRGEFWLDTTGRATVDDAAARDTWQPTAVDRIYPLGDGQALWIRFSVAPRSDTTHWYAEIPLAHLALATLHSRGADGRWYARSAGDRLPVAEWAVPGRQPVLPLNVSGTAPTEYLLRIEHSFATSVPVLLTEERQMLRRERLVALGLGAYFGLTLLGVVMALALAVWMRDLAALLFVVPTLLLGLSAGNFAGINGWLLWPRHAAWNHLSAFLLPTLALTAMLAFITVATTFGARAPRLRWAPWTLVLAGVAITATQPFLTDITSATATAAVCGALLLACIALPAWTAWRAGGGYALGLLIGMLCLAAPATTHILRLIGLMPTGLVSRFVLLSGAALQLAAVLVTLMRRGRDRSLTRQRMRNLAHVDPGTGVASRAAVREHLRRMTARARHQQHAYAVLLIDLVNLTEVRRKFGRRAGQELPVHLADRLLAHMREVDTVGRLGETRFVMLMDGPIDQASATRQAQRALAACLKPIKDRPSSWTPRVRMALGLLPRDGLDPAQVSDKLAILLDTVAPGDHRKLFLLGPDRS